MDSCYINETWCLRNWWCNFSLVWRKQIRKKFHWLKLYFILPKPASAEKYWTLRWNISTGCFMLHNTRSYQKKKKPEQNRLFMIQCGDKTRLHGDPQQRRTIAQCMLMESTHAHAHAHTGTQCGWESETGLSSYIMYHIYIYYASCTLPPLSNNVSLACRWPRQK